MKVIIIGYPGSQHIVPASKYLTGKYLPGFDFHDFLKINNYLGGRKKTPAQKECFNYPIRK